MKKTMKKALSLVMSIAMVVTMLPTFAITASASVADYSGCEHSYFVNSSTWNSNVTSTNVTWDSTNNYASFAASSYAKLNDRPLQGVTVSSGFIVSFDYYAGDLGADTYSMNFVNGSNRMTFINGHNNWWMRVGLEISNGTKTRVYEGDFTKTDYLSTTHNEGSNSCLWWKNVNLTYVMNTDGSLDLTVTNLENTSDTFTVTYKSNYGSTSQGHDMTDAEVATVLNSLTDYYVGAGDNTPNHDYTGRFKNLRIFPNSQAKDLQLAMIKYENKMADGKIYTNMAAAYKAYVDANEAYDALIYGDNNNAQISAAYSALNTAMGNMSSWSAYTGTASVSMIGSECSGAYSNVLYQDTSATFYSSYGSNGTTDATASCGNLQQIKEWIPRGLVLYYDGNNNNTYFPIMVEIKGKDSGGNRQVSYVHLGTSTADYNGASSVDYDSDLALKQNWKGSVGWNNPINWSSMIGGSTEFGYQKTDNYTLAIGDSTNFFANIAYFKGSSNYSNASKRVYYVLYNPQRNATRGIYMDMSLYIVDYSQLKTAIANKSSWLSKVSDYKEGGLSGLFEAYDDATAFDITKYRTGYSAGDYNGGSITAIDNSNYGSYYTYAESACESFAAGINNASIGTADAAANYIALRNAIDYSGEPTGINGGDFDGTVFSVREVAAANGKYNVVNNAIVLTSSGSKTLTGYSAFATAYTNAVNVMAALGTSGYNTNTNSNYTDGANAASKATALTSAFNGLSAIDLNAPTVSGETYLGPNNTLTVTDTNSGNATYTWQYSTDSGTSWTNGGTLTIATSGGSTTFSPFSNNTLRTAGTALVRVVSTRTVNSITANEYDNPSGVTHTYFTAPTVTIGGNAVTNNQVVTANTTVNFATTKAGASGTLQYSLDGGGWTTGSSVTVFSGNTTTATIQVKEITAGGSTSELTSTYTLKRKPNAPSVQVDSAAINDGTYLDKTKELVPVANDGSENAASTLQYSTDGTNYSNYTSGTTHIVPFSGKADGDATDSATYYFKAVRNGAESEVTGITVNYLARPTLKYNNAALADDQELTATGATGTLTLTSNNSTQGTLKYFISDDNGSTWKEFTGSSFMPFSMVSAGNYNYTDDVTLLVKACEVNGGSTSAYTDTFTVLKNNGTTFSMYWVADSDTNKANKLTGTFDENGKFYLTDSEVSAYLGKRIYYTATCDGVTQTTLFSNNEKYYTYDINNGIDSDEFQSFSVVTFNFYTIKNDSKSVFATGTFCNKTYNSLLFRESFDDKVSVETDNGTTTLTRRNSDNSVKYSATAKTADSISIVEGAGWKDSNGNSPDWRNNVLKFNATGSTGASAVTLSSNPYADAGAKAVAKHSGITISYWRYVPGGDGDSGRNTANVGDWTPTVSFHTQNNNYEYFDIMATAYVTRSDGAIDGDSSKSDAVDYKPDHNDYTQHATGNNRNRWINIVVTVDPTDGIMIYTNGEPHHVTVEYPSSGTSKYNGMSNSALAADILDFITSGTTEISLADGHAYWSLSGKDLYLDDIRMYTGVMTQVEINNMYTDELADVQSPFSSNSHDPTNVTVYSLKSGFNYTVPGGSSKTTYEGQQVGQEFIDYYGISATDSTKIKAIDYYSFGTGMTVYHWNASARKWEVVGDSQGRCGYQNQDLFGAEYHTALATPLAYAEGGSTGGGHLVWAPHVMYNLTTDSWMYYGSTSSWGSQKSAIFMCENVTSDDVTGPYTYKEVVYRSAYTKNGVVVNHPNAIDACVYYEYTRENDESPYKPDPSSLHMIFGSWGGESAIAYKPLNSNGTTNDNEYFDSIICYGVNSSLEGASDGSSGEGGYIIFENGYYYLYVSYGQNTGSYVQRVWRSNSPNGGFESYRGNSNLSATDNSTHATHGGQILAPFDMSVYDYIMVSTGHNSVYKAVNDYGEVVTVNSVHARPNASESHNMVAIPDNALATAQLDGGPSPNGNVNMVNQIAYTYNGWPVMMPYQYDGRDTVKASQISTLLGHTVTAADIEGVYTADDLQITEYYNWAGEYTYTIVADEENPMGAFEYGTDDNGDVFKDYIVFSIGDDGTLYANYYASKNNYNENHPQRDVEYFGVVGMHNGTVCISMIDTDDFEYTWTHRSGNIPKSDDVASLGDSVSMDGVIYTHKAKDSYAKYGYEISDDFSYGTDSQHQGERCTTIKTTYPAKIDLSDPSAVYCLSDEALCKTGEYSGGDFSVVALNNNKWYYTDNGTTYYISDAEAVAAVENNRIQASALHRLYGLKGYVSNYYFDPDTGKYAEKGVELIVSYKNVETGASYSEFEFCFVSPNPVMAHTIQGIRNQSNDGGTNRRGGQILYDRFLGSYGAASEIITTHVKGDINSSNGTSSTGDPKLWGTGLFNYADVWGNSDSVSATYNSPQAMKDKFTFFGSKVGINAGSYGMIEHDDTNEKAYTVSSNVVDTDYYIDYSNTDNYDINNKYGLITTSNGKPTGYAFDFRTSNIKWRGSDDQNRRWNATSYVFTSGEAKSKLTLNSTYDSSKDTYVAGSESSNSNEQRYTYGNYYTADSYVSYIGKIFDTAATAIDGNHDELKDLQAPYTNEGWRLFASSGSGNKSTNESHPDAAGNYANKDTLSLNKQNGTDDYRKVVNGYYYDSDAYWINYGDSHYYYTQGLTRGLPLIDSGNSDTNAWNMHITFSGRDSVAKNADPGSGNTERAEKYANFILEQGITVFSWWGTGKYITAEENYAYYNIGVHACDKGAARTFADTYLNKKLVTTTDPTTGEVTVTLDANGAPTIVTEAGVEQTIEPQYCTLASYQEYIDAMAELCWVVENPENTRTTDYNPRATAQDYSTAYTAGGDPIYVTNVGGDNIFDDNVSNVHTDEVQAQLIKNVITAYENLFSHDDYVSAKDAYGRIVIDTTTETDDTIRLYSDSTKESLVKTINKADYTTDSWNNFVALISDVSGAFVKDANVDTGSTSWRYVDLTGAEYRHLHTILNNIDGSLMPKVDTTELNTLITAKTAAVNGGIFTDDNGAQQYTFQSWKAIKDRIPAAEALRTPTAHDNDAQYTENGNTTYFDMGKFDVTGVTKYQFDDVTYYAQEFDDTAFTSSNYTTVGHPSVAQISIYQELADNSSVLGGKNLVALDSASAYQSYDAAWAVIDGSINRDKYYTSALADLDEELLRKSGGYTLSPVSSYDLGGTVYLTLGSTLVDEYNTATGASISTSTAIKNVIGSGTVDSFTTHLLSVANDLEDQTKIDTNVKKFTGTVNVTDSEGNPVDAYELGTESPYTKTLTNSARDGVPYFYYGDDYTVDIPAAAQGKSVITITSKNPYSTPTANAEVGSQKVSYNGESFTKKAINTVDITIQIKEKELSQNYYKVQVKNIYGAIVETVYVTEDNLNALLGTEEWESKATLDFTSATATAGAVPFYKFEHWDYNKNTTNKTAVFTPRYSAAENVNLYITGATSVTGAGRIGETTQYQTSFDSMVTITGSDIYGWATYANSKYQIAAYGNTVRLYAVTDETFYPITKSGDDYYANGAKLTASNVDVKFTVTDATADSLLKQKLDNKKPFVTIIDVDTVTNSNNKFASATGYCRVTTGTGVQPYSEIGVVSTTKTALWSDDLMVKNSASVFKTSTVLSTGQYTYTLTASTNGFAQIAFRGYIAYDLDYSAAGETATLNVDEYSSTIIQKTPTV